MKLDVATCQFPTSADIDANLGFVLRLMREAKSRGGEVAHFPEAFLSGYAGSDLESHADTDWPVAAHRSCWPSFFVRPDGVITGRLGEHETGVLISQVDTETPYYDSTAAWRERAMAGVLHSGDLVRDARSDDRTAIQGPRRPGDFRAR